MDKNVDRISFKNNEITLFLWFAFIPKTGIGPPELGFVFTVMYQYTTKNFILDTLVELCSFTWDGR